MIKEILYVVSGFVIGMWKGQEVIELIIKQITNLI